MSKNIANKILLKEQKEIYFEGRLSIIFVLLVVLLIGLISTMYESSTKGFLLTRCLLYFIPTITYFTGFIFYNKLENRFLIPGVLLFVYIFHSMLEIAFGYYPTDVLKPANLSTTGHLTRGGAIIEVIPTIYLAFRLALTIVFIRLLLIARKIKIHDEIASC